MHSIRKPSVVAVLLILFAAAFLSACGSKTAFEGGSSPAASNNTAANTPASASSAPSAKPEAEKATRIVSTVNGDVEIPAKPKRIVALYYHHILLALGEKPVGANLTWWGGSPFLKELESGMKDVGGPPSLEAVAALEPDLIIMNSNNTEDYNQFAKIAPSVLIPYDGNRNVYDDTKLIAEMLGKAEMANQVSADFEKKAAEARTKLKSVLDGGVKAAIIRIDNKGGQFSVFGDNYGRGGWSIYKGLQIQYPAKVKEAVIDSGKQIVQELSLEQMLEFVKDADYLFVSNEGSGLETVKDSAVWNSIPAVKAGRVIELDKKYFYFDPISISAQLDLITDLFLKLQVK